MRARRLARLHRLGAAHAVLLAAVVLAPARLFAHEADEAAAVAPGGSPLGEERADPAATGVAQADAQVPAAADLQVPAPAAAAAPAVIAPAPAAVRFPLPEGTSFAPQAIAEARLDSLRGGFDDGSGLRVSLGIERAAYVNGALVTHTRFHLPDATRLTAAQAREVAAAVGGVQLVQNGAGNLFLPGAAAGAGMATVIQNSLNDQTLRSVTTIDAASNSLRFFKSDNAYSTLRDALAAPLGPR